MIQQIKYIFSRTAVIVTLMKGFATFLLLLVLFKVQAQEVQQKIENKFDSYREHHLQEKIFVHTDKSNYATGEICWFKIYNADAVFHKPLSFSKVVYAEILDKNNRTILQVKIAMDSSTGNGSFYLPASIVSGNYRLRAYTNWMKNEGAEYFFEKTISIVNAEKLVKENTASIKPAYEAAFFPEGGNLVAALESTVGFKVNDQYGRGISFEGTIINEKGDTITQFRPFKFGMGHFSFTPADGSKYTALIKLPGGGQLQKELPEVYHKGYVMHLVNEQDQLKITVSVPDRNTSAALFLFVHTRNVVKVAMTNMIQNGQATFNIDQNKCGEGISQFTIFDDSGQPVCERLYFKKPSQTLQLKAVPNLSAYTLREKISLAVTSSTEAGKATPANMSMAVYRIDSINTINQDNINNYLLLTSDLTGAVEAPDYYFTNNSDSVNAAVDDLMLTQGWRRFKWHDILSDKKKPVEFLPEINGHIITGKVTPLKPGAPLDYITAYLSAPGTLTQFQNASSNSDGKVKFEMKNFYTNGELIVQTNNQMDSFYQVNIDQPFYTSYSSKVMQPFKFEGKQDALLKMYISTQVQNSFLSNKLNQSSIPISDTSFFYGKPDAVYLLDNYVRFTTVEEVLREYVPEVIVRRHNNKFSLPIFDKGTKFIFDSPPLILLDGVPVFNIDKLMVIDALKIRKLEVVARRYILGNNIFYGIANFTTYKGDMGGFELDPHATVIDYEGLQQKRDFYSPLYNTQEKLLSRLPDFRNLLYWSPDVITNTDGKKQIDFYCSDIPGKYAVVIQGLCSDGRAGTGVVYFDVNDDNSVTGK